MTNNKIIIRVAIKVYFISENTYLIADTKTSLIPSPIILKTFFIFSYLSFIIVNAKDGKKKRKGGN
jgi:hypothetical protein